MKIIVYIYVCIITTNDYLSNLINNSKEVIDILRKVGKLVDINLLASFDFKALLLRKPISIDQI